MPLAEDLGQHGEAFLAAVFLIAADEDDVLAFAGAVLPFVSDRTRSGPEGCRDQAKEGEQ